VNSPHPDLRFPDRLPEAGELIRMRPRTWLVEEVVEAAEPGHSARVALACADDDAQGEELEELAFVTSTNLTEAALDRNIEMGVLLRDRAFATAVVGHFRGLIERQLLLRLPAE